MLQPKRIKYRKQQRGRRKGRAVAGSTIVFGEYGLISLDNAWVTARQIEAARRAITHHMKRGGQVWIRIFPDKPVTCKPAETRQGSGKGAVDHWVAVVRRGRVLFEVADITEDLAREALRLAAHKLPIATKFVAKAAKAKGIEAEMEEAAPQELEAVGVEQE